jgi:hypothetical protein
MRHEADAVLVGVSGSNQGYEWRQIEPHLNDALRRLNEADRNAVILRVFQEMSFGEVGQALGVGEDTARMRVNRALAKVRSHLQRVGVAVSVAALMVLLTERGSAAPPPGLSDWIERQNEPAFTTRPSPTLTFGLTRTVLLSSVVTIALVSAILWWRASAPSKLTEKERTQVFRAMRGQWNGTLEYADDRTKAHYTYPTQVEVKSSDTHLEFTAKYRGSSGVDRTTFDYDGRSFIVQNAGPGSTHRLFGLGSFAGIGKNDIVFEGSNVPLKSSVRIRLQLQGNMLQIEEDDLPAGEKDYSFRNRFTLHRQP